MRLIRLLTRDARGARWVRGWAVVIVGLAATVAPHVRAQSSPFVGSWNMTGTGADADLVYWLEVKEADGKLTGSFLNRVGNPSPLGSVKVEGGELVFQAG